MSILPLGGRGSFETEITRGGGWGGRRRGKVQGCQHRVQKREDARV